MIFTPSSEVYARIVSDAGGVWVDRSQNEPPLHLIREIAVGVPVDLRVWVVVSDGQLLFTVFGFNVHEGQTSSVAAHGACRSTDEIVGLQELLTTGSFPLQVHNENTLPIFHARCRINTSAAAEALAAMPTGPYAEGEGYVIRGRANDIVEASLESDVPDPRITERIHVRIRGCFQRRTRQTDPSRTPAVSQSSSNIRRKCSNAVA